MHAYPVAAIVLPIAAGKEAALDTLESISYYCPEPHLVVIIDDHTTDGTYEALVSNRRNNWQILRNPRPLGWKGLAQGLCSAYRHVLNQEGCGLVLKLDQDALIIKPGILSDALAHASANPSHGIFGVYAHDYNRPRSFEGHRKIIDQEAGWLRLLTGSKPPWLSVLKLADRNGYEHGSNVFGGAHFLTRPCLEAMSAIGALDVPCDPHSRLLDDIYFSMACVAAGFKMGHFAAPEGPLCLEWRGLPYPAKELIQSHYKIVHSVDKGKNTGPADNEGLTAREVFRRVRQTHLDTLE